MKIFEKKCPNCKANLKFKAGEHDAVCESCRRSFVIDYGRDSDIGNNPNIDFSKFDADEITLTPQQQKNVARLVIIVFATTFIIIAISVVFFVNIFIKANSTNLDSPINDQLYDETYDQIHQDVIDNIQRDSTTDDNLEDTVNEFIQDTIDQIQNQ